jgi:two-component system, LytTR family, response regulator
MTLRAIVVDDEKVNRELLSRMVDQVCVSVRVVATVSSVKEAVTSIDQLKPDLVFLDVEMPDANGFELFNYFESPSFQVVFVTAHEHYALEAIRKNAFDYLVKPIDPKELIKVEQRLLAASKRGESELVLWDSYQQKFDDLKQFIESSKRELDKKLFLPTLGGFRLISIQKVQFIEAKGSYSQIKLMDGSNLLVTKTIGDLESELAGSAFYRCHKSFLVNLHFVDSYHQSDGGHCTTVYGEIIPVARRKYTTFVEQLLAVVGTVKPVL